MRLQDDRVSRAHAEVTVCAGGLAIRDLGSRHGSAVGGCRLGGEAATASFGTVVRFGNTLLLAVGDIERYRAPPRLIDGLALGMSQGVVAGPNLSGVWDEAARAASLDYPVLIVGESGTGKEVVARIVHRARHADRPFVSRNIAAIPEALFEAELFGYERGAFTGALVARQGAFREADGGVLFLDEIGDLRTDLQAKLLRALDQRTARPLGANRDFLFDVRLVTATNQDLELACADARFRLDLYHRLAGVVIRIPPLRERPDDILLLALSALDQQVPGLTLTASAAERLALGAWQGNARELRAALARAAMRATTSSRLELVESDFPDVSASDCSETALTESRIRTAMRRAGGVASKAAESLGVSRATFYNTCKRLGLEASVMRSSLAGEAPGNGDG